MITPALLSVAIVGAQAPAGQPPTQPPTQSSQEKPAQATEMGKVTVTGCVKAGPTAGSWVLDNVQASVAPGAKPGPTTDGTASTTAGTAGTKQTYNLISKPGGADLKPHANHKIEVTGTAGAMSPAAAKPGETPASGTAAQQNFNIESFKMVATTCP